LVSGLDEGKYSKYLNTNLREGNSLVGEYKYQYGTDNKGNVIVIPEAEISIEMAMVF
jgi:hypothetical protein